MYRPIYIDYFKKQLKKIAKKDPRAKKIVIETLNNFKKESSIHLGRSVYKIRIRRNDKGKSGGYRLLIYVRENENLLVPFCIYSKAEQENISLEAIDNHLEIARKTLAHLFQN